jgi:hypothetical protein
MNFSERGNLSFKVSILAVKATINDASMAPGTTLHQDFNWTINHAQNYHTIKANTRRT